MVKMLNLLNIPSATVVPEVANENLDDPDNPEMSYAQVLAEARSYIATHLVPCVQTAHNGSSGAPQFSRSTSARHHGSNVQAAAAAGISSRAGKMHLKKSLEDLKSSRSWKNSLFFWRKSKKHKNPNYYSSRPCPGQLSSERGSHKRANSGPIYTSEVSIQRCSLPSSGSISGSATPTYRKYPSDFPYMQLRHHQASQISCRAPLYIVT